jgi:hypothetical protein
MASTTPTDESLKQDADYRSRLSRALWFRNQTQPSRFVFSPASPAGLLIEPLTRAGAAALVTHIKALRDRGLHPSAGAVYVDDDGRLVFCGRNLPPDLLKQLADWARQNARDIPAVANLIGAGVAPVGTDLAGDEAIRALDLDDLTVQRDPAVWSDLLPPTAATTASVLADRLPGERMWYWLSNDVPDGVAPLLVQPVAWDPNRDRQDLLILQAEAAGAGEAATGTCMVVDDGRLQLLGAELYPGLLRVLAEWVRSEAGRHPGLARLWNCQLLRTSGGRVQQVIEDAGLWAGVPRPVAPGTLGEAASLLERLGDGQEYWFWATAAGNDGPFLGLSPVAADPDGTAFRERVAAFYKRFPESFRDALSGVVRRVPGGGLLFSTKDARVDHWPALARSLAERHAGAHPGLAPVAEAALVQIRDGQVARTLSAAGTPGK